MRARRAVAALAILLGIAAQSPSALRMERADHEAQSTPVSAVAPDVVDGLMAPVALYPDQLLAQMLVSSTMPARVKALDAWLKTKPPFKGTALQDAARQQGFEPSLVALVIFPQVVDFMTVNLDWTTEVGEAFTASRASVLDSVQRLRADALKTGKLKTSDQLSISLKSVEGGRQVIVIEPANPQVMHVPQYDTKAVYSQAPTSTTVVIQEDDDDAAEAMAAGLIGFTAGVVIGAAIDNDYYYGPYGWHGSPYMYNDAWDDWYDDREDAREDWYEHREDAREDVLDHREDMAESRGDRASTAQQQRGERATRAQQQGTDRQQARQQGQASTQSSTRSTASSSAAATSTSRSSGGSASTYQARGQDRERSSTAAERSGTRSDAFSNYSSGKSERSASSRGKSSRSSSRSGGRSRR